MMRLSHVFFLLCCASCVSSYFLSIYRHEKDGFVGLSCSNVGAKLATGSICFCKSKQRTLMSKNYEDPACMSPSSVGCRYSVMTSGVYLVKKDLNRKVRPLSPIGGVKVISKLSVWTVDSLSNKGIWVDITNEAKHLFSLVTIGRDVRLVSDNLNLTIWRGQLLKVTIRDELSKSENCLIIKMVGGVEHPVNITKFKKLINVVASPIMTPKKEQKQEMKLKNKSKGVFTDIFGICLLTGCLIFLTLLIMIVVVWRHTRRPAKNTTFLPSSITTKMLPGLGDKPNNSPRKCRIIMPKMILPKSTSNTTMEYLQVVCTDGMEEERKRLQPLDAITNKNALPHTNVKDSAPSQFRIVSNKREPLAKNGEIVKSSPRREKNNNISSKTLQPSNSNFSPKVSLIFNQAFLTPDEPMRSNHSNGLTQTWLERNNKMFTEDADHGVSNTSSNTSSDILLKGLGLKGPITMPVPFSNTQEKKEKCIIDDSKRPLYPPVQV